MTSRRESAAAETLIVAPSRTSGSSYGRARLANPSKWLVAVFGLTATACSRCDHKPYVPYGIDEAGTADASAGAGDAGPGRRASVVAPPNASRWTIEGEEWTAPSEQVFVAGLPGDFDGNGVRDLIAITHPTLRPKEVAVVRLENGTPPTIYPFAGLEACEAEPRRERLEALDRKTILVEISEGCDGARRDLFVLTTKGSSFALRFRALLENPAGAAPLTLDTSTADLDGDAVPDLELRIGDGTTSLPLRFLDRPSGLSLDASEPNATLAALATALRAKGAKLVELLPKAALLREMYVGICETRARLRLTEGRGCPPAAAYLDLVEAEAKGRLTTGDAIGAAELYTLLGERVSEPKRLEALAKTVRAALPTVPDALVRELLARPTHAPPGAHAGPIEFDQAGTLEVLVDGGVVQADLRSLEETKVGSSPWPTTLISPSQTRRLLDVKCEPRGTFAHVVNAAAQVDEREVLLRAVGCAIPRSSSVRPVASSEDGFYLLVDGAPLALTADFAARRPALKASSHHVKGGAASPAQKHVVLPISLFGRRLVGFLASSDKPRLLQARDLEADFSALSDCVINDGGDTVACVRRDRVVVATFRLP